MICFYQLLPFLFIAPSFIYSVLTLAAASGFFNRKRPAFKTLPPVTIIKPVKGSDQESYANFASFCRQEYDTFQIIFSVSSPDDSALPVIRSLITEFPQADIDIVIDDRIYGLNYKVCKLINAFPLARHDIIVVCDSDIRVGSSYLRAVCAHFADPSVGLVSSLYRTSSVKGAVNALEALGFTADMLPNVMTARMLEGLTFALGASMAVRRDALEKIGGFESLVDYLADDYQLGNRVFRTGYRLELSEYFIESVMCGEKLSTILSRQLRWSRTIRFSRPGGFFLSGMTQPIIASLAALLAGGFETGCLAAALLYLIRATVATIYSRIFICDRLLPKYLWLLPFRDLFASLTWGAAFLGNRVSWRGHCFRVKSGGILEEINKT